MNNRKLTVGITQGDGNGIGYEVIIKAFSDERILEMCTPVIYGSSKIFGFYRKQIHNIEQINTNVVNSARDAHQKRVNIVNCLPDNVYVEPGQPTADSAKAAMISLEKAVEEINKVQWIENLRYMGYEFYVLSHAYAVDIPHSMYSLWLVSIG